MVVFFSSKVEPWKTKLNKLLFYADFLAFKKTCFSMSGVKYRAIKMGPVPSNFNSIFEYLVNKNDVDVQIHEFSEDSIGEKFVAHPEREFNDKLFTSKELEILNQIATFFKESTTNNIIKFSHNEVGWLENNKKRDLISYKYAFDITQL